MSRTVACALVYFALVVALVGTASAPVAAATSPGCFRNMAQCFETTAFIESFWYRTWEALDCELGLISCVRIAVFGL